MRTLNKISLKKKKDFFQSFRFTEGCLENCFLAWVHNAGIFHISGHPQRPATWRRKSGHIPGAIRPPLASDFYIFVCDVCEVRSISAYVFSGFFFFSS